MKQLKLPAIFLILNILLLWVGIGSAQISIHQEDLLRYRNGGFNGGNPKTDSVFLLTDTCRAEKIIFGYHPYWVGDAWKNYHWNLLTDLCYFSYEVDPATGNPLTLNGWETAKVIDTALTHGTRVHLCVTLFSGHASFFQNASARQQLITNLINLLKERHAQGVNLDFEAVSSSQSVQYNDFLVAVADSLHQAVPGCLISMASPAVDWSNMLDLPRLSGHLDFFMIMGYDYYWNGSGEAGPVAGQFPMLSSYPYSVTRTINSYLSKGIVPSQLVLGLPYYGRDWPVNGPVAPSAIRANGTALTYRNYRINTSMYTAANKRFEPVSRSWYYSYKANGWNQCFVDDEVSLGNKYELINRYDLAGAGIWALGYDDGYQELWNLLRDKFSGCRKIICSDTLFDTGGPELNYPGNEVYSQMLQVEEGDIIRLEFTGFNLEAGDTLKVINGPEPEGAVLGMFTGSSLPPVLTGSGNELLMLFSSGSSSGSGWKAVYKCPSAGIIEPAKEIALKVFPNPTNGSFTLAVSSKQATKACFQLYDINGKAACRPVTLELKPGENLFGVESIGLNHLAPGIYSGQIRSENGGTGTVKIIVYQ